VTLVTPISARVYYDPALQYLLSSLEPFVGRAYHYIDHPGTPVEVLGTAVLGATYPFTASNIDSFVAYHLAHPELFMTLGQTLLVMASIATYLLLVRRAFPVRHWTQAIAAVGIAGAFFGLHPEAFTTLAIWSHTSFCFIGGTLLSLMVVMAVRTTRPPAWRHVLALGVAGGVLTSVQLYFAAWVIGTTVAVVAASRLHGSTTRSAVRLGEATIGMALLGFVLATLPIHDQYLNLAAWIIELIAHQGNYGDGPTGFSTPERFASNLQDLALVQPGLFIATLAGVGIFVWRLLLHPSGENGPQRAAGLGLVVQIIVLLVLVAKHPGQRYLLPIAATLPMLWAVLAASFDPFSAASRRFSAAVGVVCLGLFGGGLVSATTAHLTLADTLRRDDASIHAWLEEHASERGIDANMLRVFWTYGTASQCQALWYAQYSADNIFADRIASLCPRDGSIDIWKEIAWTASGRTPLSSLRNWDVEVIPANLLRSYPGAALPGIRYETSLSATTPSYGSLVLIARQST
jgi:hypothetical protein